MLQQTEDKPSKEKKESFSLNQFLVRTNLKDKTLQIEITGGIASGKTTFAETLDNLNFLPVFENFQANPFWKAFYADPAGNAFETEIGFLLQHYHEIKAVTKQSRAFACDFSLLLDLAYAQVTLDEGKRKAFTAVYREIRRELPAPDLVIHLVCEPEIELERIRRRGRDVEQSITADYLDAINHALLEILSKEADTTNVLTINSATVNFADDETDKEAVLEAVRCRLANITK